MRAHFGISFNELTWGVKWPYMVRVMADQGKPSKKENNSSEAEDAVRAKINMIKGG